LGLSFDFLGFFVFCFCFCFGGMGGEEVVGCVVDVSYW